MKRKRLNNREVNMAIVMVDLFSKGSPEYRIAEHGKRLAFTDQQFSNFLDKLDCLSEEVKFVIHTHFRDIGKGECHDKAKHNRQKLWKWGLFDHST